MRHFSLNYRFSEDIRNNNFPLLKEHLRNYQDEIGRMDDKLRTEAVQNEIKIGSLREKLSGKQEELDEIKKGKNKYDEKITRLISVIRTELEKKYKKEIKKLLKQLTNEELKRNRDPPAVRISGNCRRTVEECVGRVPEYAAICSYHRSRLF